MEEIPKTHQDFSVRSPFSETKSSLETKRLPSRAGIWATAILAGILIAGIIVFFVQKNLGNPLRSLQPFPVLEYYDNHTSLEGTRFKATLKVVRQIGWKDTLGRLVIFNVDKTDNAIVALVPSGQEAIPIKPGDTYAAELHVEEGGLLTVHYLTKE